MCIRHCSRYLVNIFSPLAVFLKIVLRFSIELLNLVGFFKIVNLHIKTRDLLL